MNHWVVYLSGEIHSDWRERIRKGADKAGLNARETCTDSPAISRSDENPIWYLTSPVP